eukprot:768639-Hanusia_phi.AAC.3
MWARTRGRRWRREKQGEEGEADLDPVADGEAEDLIFFHKCRLLSRALLTARRHLLLLQQSLSQSEDSAAAAHRRAMESQRRGPKMLTRVGDASEETKAGEAGGRSRSRRSKRRKRRKRC